MGPADAIRLFRATLCTSRRRIERATGLLPTEGDGLEAMLDHVLVAWGWAGPYPSYSSNNLVAADQWYAEQYDRWASPIAGKVSHVVIS